MFFNSWVLSAFVFIIIIAKIGYYISIGRSIYINDKTDKITKIAEKS